MSYGNRKKKTMNRKGEGFKLYLADHKQPYMGKWYSDTIDPHTGKYHGWQELHWKERGLKKRHRAYARNLIAEQLLLMQEMEPCPYCGSPFCENRLACKDEEEQMWEFEREMYKREMKAYFLYELEEEDEDDWKFSDPYMETYEHEDYAW